MNSTVQDVLTGRVEALRRAYLEQLPARVARIGRAWKGLRLGWTDLSLAALRGEIQSLAGSSDALGFVEVADCARNLEVYLQSSSAEPSAFREQVDDFLDSLQEACLLSVRGVPVSVGDEVLPVGELEQPRVARILYMLSEENGEAHDLGLELGYYGYAVRRFHDTQGLIRSLHQAVPTAVLIDAVPFAQRLQEAAELHKIRRELSGQVPMFFLSSRSDVGSRLQALRCGSDAYFVKPVESRRLVERLDLFRSSKHSDPYRVLIVEEDYARGLEYTLTLQSAGMAPSLVDDPSAVWGALVDFEPDLLLLSLIDTPHAGFELAALLRQQQAYVHIPILMVSEDQSLQARLAAMQCSADDYLEREVDPQHLLSTIASHVKRARARQTLVTVDGLTGLVAHSKFIERLDWEVDRALQKGTPLCYAILDIDHLHGVNEAFGHLSGNSALRALGRLLARRLRAADIVSRWGSDEFVVLMPETHGRAGLRVLDQVRAMYCGITHRSGELEFTATFSGGLSELNHNGTQRSLHQIARGALQMARARGRNRLELATDSTL